MVGFFTPVGSIILGPLQFPSQLESFLYDLARTTTTASRLPVKAGKQSSMEERRTLANLLAKLQKKQIRTFSYHSPSSWSFCRNRNAIVICSMSASMRFFAVAGRGAIWSCQPRALSAIWRA